MDPAVADKVAIAGIGHTEYSKNSGRSELQLASEASLAAIRDAGLAPADIDGMVTFTLDTNDELELMNCLGVRELTYFSRTTNGGAGACATVMHAAMAVASGMSKAVLVYRAFNERSGRRFGVPAAGLRSKAENYSAPFGVRTPAQAYSLTFQHYMHKYGVTNEDLGKYSVVARRHAATNPDAWFYQQPITLEDHQNSRWIVEPVLRLLDCCQESDGGVAIVVTSPERARETAHGGVRILAAAQGEAGGSAMIYDYYHPDVSSSPEFSLTGDQLWRDSGLKPGDVSAAMLYENFSPVVFMQLEAFGFCGPGEARDFIAEGNIGLSGILPVNTHGGLLGEAYIHGLNSILEGVRQLRGTAANQLDTVDHVLSASGRSALLLGRV
ncbi:MAG TPA: lipid-transfer protein [Frankiaceae bacterium]|jgi:acetyl-CoA acetyltransferase|nr:lipid-transfer protein [Frankiaceae bacterium]